MSPLATRFGRRQFRRPALMVMTGFAAGIAAVTVLLLLPVAAEGDRHTTFLQALFTATSAVCVTGLVVVDTPSHWSGFGDAAILVGIQLGGLGFMTAASLLGLTVVRRFGLRTRLLAAAETGAVDLGDVRRVVRLVALVAFGVEGAVATVLALRFWLEYGYSPGTAAYHGIYHAVSAYNNAGFALYGDSIIGFATDPVVVLPMALAVVVGGLGFPVLIELGRRRPRLRRWSVHSKVTLLGTALLLAGGSLAFTVFEWRNPGTLGPLDVSGKLLVGAVQGGVMPRTAGFNAIDYAQADETTLLITDVLMFIGGGSGGTAGGIKVGTFFVLFFAILAESRGDSGVEAFGRQVPTAVLRQALSVALLGVALVVSATLVMLAVSDFGLDRVLFEVTSAFGTVGLSTGITAALPAAGQYVLIALMFVGRLGPVTVATAMALRERPRLYTLPVERPGIG